MKKSKFQLNCSFYDFVSLHQDETLYAFRSKLLSARGQCAHDVTTAVVGISKKISRVMKNSWLLWIHNFEKKIYTTQPSATTNNHRPSNNALNQLVCWKVVIGYKINHLSLPEFPVYRSPLSFLDSWKLHTAYINQVPHLLNQQSALTNQ